MALAPYSHRKKMSLRQYLVVLGVMAAVLILAVAIRLMYGGIVLSTALTKDFLFEPAAVAVAQQDSAFAEKNTQQDVLLYRINTQLSCTIKDGTVELMAENPSENPYYLRVEICTEQGEPLLETGLIKPGYRLERAVLPVIPEKGNYRLTVTFTAYQIATLELAGSAVCQGELTVK